MTNNANKFDRIVVLVDMDCFYCQVEEKLNPTLRGKPIAVVQYNAWKGGGIIAVNYPARNRGVTRHMRGDEAAEHCPDIELVRVPNVREKADLSKYRDAGKEVAAVLQTFSPLLERASVDEAYLDITHNVNERLKDMDKGTFTVKPEMLVNTYALGYENIGTFVQTVAVRMRDGGATNLNDPSNNDVKLLIAATVVTDIRRTVKEKTGYECSAGIAHNKILGKLVCGLNKPNKQTLLPITHVEQLFRTMNVKKIQGLGGKFGETVCDTLHVTKLYELADFSLEELQRKFDDKNGLWLYNIARGIDQAPVTPKFSSKSIGCCKKFPGRTSIKGLATLQHWLSELSDEMFERIAQDEVENNRKPRQITVSFAQDVNRNDVHSTRSVPLNLVDSQQMAADALDVIKRNTAQFYKPGQAAVLNDPIVFLGLSVGKFEDLSKGGGKGNTIMSMFSNKAKQNEELAARAAAAATAEALQSKKKHEEFIVPEIQSPAKHSVSDNQTLLLCESQKKSPKPTDQSDESIFLDDTLEEEEETSETSNAVTTTTDVPETNPIENCAKSEQPKSFFGVKRKSSTSDSTSLKGSPEQQKSFFAKLKSSIANQTTSKTETFQSSFETSEDHQPHDETFHQSSIDQPSEQPSTSSSSCGPKPEPDYKSTYAEYHQIMPTVIPTEICSQCNRKVPVHEMQSHTDAHFAYQLSQEQRLEFRQSQSKSIVKQPSAKKPRLNNHHSASQPIKSATAPGSSSLLHKFLQKCDSAPKENINPAVAEGSDSVPTEKCSECDRLIRIDRMQEHTDFHTAKRLQMEINRVELSSSSSSSQRTFSAAGPSPKPGSVAAFFKRNG